MKKFSIVCFIALIAFSCNEKKEASTTTDWFVDNLKGEVKSVEETPYKTDSTGKVGDMDSCCISLAEYDSLGNIAKVTSKDSKGNIKSQQTFVKFPNGMFKEIATSENGKPTSRITIQLDKDEKKYASAQNFDSTGKMDFYYKDFIQNEYNQLTAMKRYKPDSTLKSSEVNKYDKQVWVEGSSSDSSGKQTYKGSAKLDDKMNVIEYSATTTSKDSSKKDTTTTKVTKYRYDSYDDQGNWTQRTEMDEKGKPTKVSKRMITYFKK